MSLDDIQPGDMIFAAKQITNDGGIPEIPQDAVLAKPGTRGVLMNIGHLEEAPDTELFLVRFEDDNARLGPPVGCWADEISTDPLGTE
jgi:nitrogen fixation protein NifZ